MLARLFVLVAALILGVQVVRSAAVDALADTSPETAERFWSGHPSARITGGMTDIAKATALRRPIDSQAVLKVIAASAMDPLRPEPFLVRGVQAQMSGDAGIAADAFREAAWRDGRSLPARYFLADQYLRSGDADRGLREVAVLSRLSPQGPAALAPYVATYARDSRNWPRLLAMFRSQPMLADATLVAMAQDPGNAAAVLRLGAYDDGIDQTPWLQTLFTALLKAEQYDRARSIWASRYGRAAAEGLIVDPGFKDAGPIPPFNWSLTSSTVGLAERQPGGGLHAIYYGQEDGPLASQLLILKPGAYRLTAAVNGAPANAEALQWRLTCLPTNAQVTSTSIGKAARGWRIEIPTVCAAQRLELFGVSSDIARQTEVRISRVSLVAEPGHG